MKRHFPALCVLLAAFAVIGCKSEDSSVIDTTFSTQQPHIATLTVVPDATDTGVLPPDPKLPDDTVTINAVVTLGLQTDTPPSTITAATVKVYSETGSVLETVKLLNDGVAPDATANDALLTGRATLRIKRKEWGSYRFSALIVSTDGGSDGRQISINIINSSNHAPVVSDLFAPDTVEIPSTLKNVYLFAIRASDPEGLSDITSVGADVFNNAGQKTGRVEMFDDGDVLAHGDSTANDGKFSVLVQIDSTNSHNTVNTFKFYAVDRANAVSDTISKTIYTK